MSSVRHVVNASRSFNPILVPSLSPLQSFRRWPQHVIFTHASSLRLPLQRRHIVFVSDVKANSVKKRRPRNYEIEYEHKNIMVVDESGIMTGPHVTRKVLENFDFSQKVLVLVAEANYDDEEGIQLAKCRIQDRAAVRNSDLLALEKKKPKKKIPVKTIEISWSVEEHDLNTKLRRLKRFLEKGLKVKILIQAKRKAKVVTREDADLLVQKIKEAVAETGARESREVEGEILDSMEMNFEGKLRSSEDKNSPENEKSLENENLPKNEKPQENENRKKTLCEDEKMFSENKNEGSINT